MTSVLINTRTCTTQGHVQKDDGHVKTEAEERSDGTSSLGMPRMAGSHQQLGEARKDSFPEISEQTWP